MSARQAKSLRHIARPPPPLPTSYHKTMSAEVVPSSLNELSEVLQDCGSAKKTVELGGNFTKRAMGGEIAEASFWRLAG